MNIDLLHPDNYTEGQPYEQLLWLQENDPVHWHHEFANGPGFWAITRYDDVKAIEADPTTFSSEPTTMIPDEKTQGDQDHKNLIFEDDPTHSLHRKFLAPELLPKSVKLFAPLVQRIVDEIIDDIVETGECDLVSDVSARLASFVTADLLGLPREDVVDMYSIGDRMMNARTLMEGDGLAAITEMGAHAQRVWESRRLKPCDDLVTRLAHGDFAGKQVDQIQFTLDFLLLIIAGGDTTRNVVSGGMRALFDFPQERLRLQTDPSLIPVAVEEMLRWTTPIAYQRRRTTVDTHIGERPIVAGDKVVMFFGAANRDRRVYEDPTRFNVTRSPNPHLAFGAGPHFCMGAHLARQELVLMFRELLKRLPDMEPSGSTRWLRTEAPIAPIIVGPKEMPVRFTPGLKLARTK